MTPPPGSAELVAPAEAEIDLQPADDVIDLTDRRRVLLQVIFGVDVPRLVADGIFDPSATDAS